MGFLDEVKKATGVNPGSADDLKRAGAGVLGGMFGNKVKDAAQPGVDKVTGAITDAGSTATNWAKVKMEIPAKLSNFPDVIDLNKSKGMTQLVERGLAATGQNVKIDGKPDQTVLDGVNALRAKAGQAPLAGLDQFTKDDFKLIVSAANDANTPAGRTFINLAANDLTGLTKDYPKPAAPAAAPAQDFNNGG